MSEINAESGCSEWCWGGGGGACALACAIGGGVAVFGGVAVGVPGVMAMAETSGQV